MSLYNDKWMWFGNKERAGVLLITSEGITTLTDFELPLPLYTSCKYGYNPKEVVIKDFMRIGSSFPRTDSETIYVELALTASSR